MHLLYNRDYKPENRNRNTYTLLLKMHLCGEILDRHKKNWVINDHNAEYKTRDRLYGKADQHPHSIDNTLLREARSTLWKCRLIKTIPKISFLKSRLIKQIPTLILMQKDQQTIQSLKKLQKMAENQDRKGIRERRKEMKEQELGLKVRRKAS